MPVVRLQINLSGVEREMTQTCSGCDHPFDEHRPRCEATKSCACSSPTLKLSICERCGRVLYYDGPLCFKCNAKHSQWYGWLCAVACGLGWLIYITIAAILFVLWRIHKS
jgi:hypothetical protein